MPDMVGLNRLESILAAVTDGIYALDAGLRFTYVNDEALRSWGRCWAGRRAEPTSWGASCSTCSPA